MKLVLLAIGLVFSVVSNSALASGCNPNDAGSEVLSKMDVVISGNLVCTAGNICEFEVSGSGLKLYGTELSAVDGSQRMANVPGIIVFEKSWGSCQGYNETVSLSVGINGQKYSSNLSSYSGY